MVACSHMWLFSTSKVTSMAGKVDFKFYLILPNLSLNNCYLTAAKSLQSYPTLCDPIDSSPPGSAIPGILQARTLEWVAVSFSNAWKWKGKGKSLSRVRLCATPETAAHQAPPSLGFSRQEHWRELPFPSPMHESEKGKGSRSVVSDSLGSYGLQPTRLLHPWDFPGKSTGVGCHHLTSPQLTTTPPSISTTYCRKTPPQPAGGRRCFPRVCQIVKQGFLLYRNKQTFLIDKNELIVMVPILI